MYAIEKELLNNRGINPYWSSTRNFALCTHYFITVFSGSCRRVL